MFAGVYPCKLDEKGRFIVPSPIREQLEAEGKGVVFIKGPEQPLYMYSSGEWGKILEGAKAKLDEEESRLFMYHVVSEAGTSDVDKAGRVLIPGRLRKMVPVDEDQEVVLVGLYNRMEIWNPADWRRHLSKSDYKLEQSLSKISNLL
ncbi:MAG: division/cell wall cluster transcriptional repressor MraZ [Nitrospirota bacterium]|jgi:MraZ protein